MSDAAIHAVDQVVTLEPTGENTVRGRTVEAWANMVGPFGGTTAATMLNAVLQHPQRLGDPLALTLNYAGPVADGEFEIEARPVRTNRSNQHWMLEMRQGGEVVTTATALTGLRRETWSETEAVPPEVPAPEDLKVATSFRTVKWLENYDMRFVSGDMVAADQGSAGGDSAGGAAGGAESSTTTMWIRDVPERALDHLSLTALCDSFFPRAFLRLGRPVPTGTVTLTIHYLATADEIAAQGSDFLLGSVHANRFHANYHDESAQLWSRDGTLLATANQLMYFKS